MKKTYSREHPWDYRRLKARTVELGKADKDVANAAKMSASTYSLKINGKGDFSQEQICSICAYLDIETQHIPAYFFTPIV